MVRLIAHHDLRQLSQRAQTLFFLKLTNSGIVLNGVSLDGIYVNIDTGDGDIIGFNDDPESEAAYFSLNANNNLVMSQEEFKNNLSETLIVYTDSGQSFELLHFDTPSTFQPSVLSLARYCSVSTAEEVVTCCNFVLVER